MFRTSSERGAFALWAVTVLILGLWTSGAWAQAQVSPDSANIVHSAPSDRAPIIIAPQSSAVLMAGRPSIRSAAPSAELERWADFDASALLAEDAKNDLLPGIPMRVGVVRQAPGAVISSDTHGSWQTLEDGTDLWVMRLDIPGALEVRVHFSTLKLQPGARLVIAGEGPDGPYQYHPEMRRVGSDFWAAGTSGSVVYIEYQDPTGRGSNPVIEIDEVLHVYRNPPLTAAETEGLRGLAPCQEDVNCHTVDQTARDSVGRMFFISGSFGAVCSGGLINDNDPNTFVGYFLTANHCLSTQSAANTLQVRWFYETDVCNGFPSFVGTTVGAALLATSPNSDFTFLRLADDPNIGQGLAAWTTNVPASNGATVHGIHHPGGSWKRYSRGITTTAAPICGGLPLTNYVYNDWTLGFTEGGSSGSPLFNANWEVIGQLFGACLFSEPACNNPGAYNAVYGRFSSTHSSIASFLNTITPDDIYEDNDTLMEGAPLDSGTHNLRLVDFDDYFEIDAGCQPNMITAIASHNTADMDLDLRLLDDTGAVLDSALGISPTKSVSASVGPGKYFVRTTKASGWGGDYTLEITVQVETDCNSNGTQDNCDVVGGTSADLNANMIPDECEDCNANMIPDEDDISAGTSADCNANSFPDDCELDCNDSGFPDDCDVAAGTSSDCDGNNFPDECDPDCNTNGTPDACDIAGATSTDLNANALPDDCEDCNGNTIPDELDLSMGTSFDCNSNGVLDECDVAAGASGDCDGNIVPDECEPDCNNNGVTDACDISGATSVDCLPDGIPDDCQADCDSNGLPDVCEIAFAMVTDCNANAVPDQCEPSLFGNALSFDGGDDHIDVGADFDVAANLTIEAWMRTPDADLKQIVFAKHAPSPLSGYAFFVEDSKLVFTALGVMRYETTSAVIANESWTHVAAAMDGDWTVRFYVDGALVDTVAGASPILSGSGQVFIGSFPPSTGDTWLGELDEVRIWSEARSDEQIAANAFSQISSPPPTLVGYWRFNTGAGLIARDQIGVHDGTLVNGPVWIETFADCNSNGAVDLCDIATGTSIDINVDGIPDDCNDDCNNNGLPDEDDLAAGTSLDCNGNMIPDECDAAAGPDCDANGEPDDCQLDCNLNSIPDVCDAAAGTGTDCNSNGKLDECEIGAPGFALSLDGVAGHVNLGRVFDTLANGFTLEAWVLIDDVTSRQMFISKRGTASDSGFAFFQENGVMRFTSISVQAYVGSTPVLTSGEWTHVAMVLDASNDVTFYKNGALVQTIAGSSPVITGNTPVHFGRLAPDASDYLAGAIDEVRVWNVERPESAIAATQSKRLIGDEPGLAGYWRLDEGQGTAVVDATGAWDDGVNNGGVWSAGHPMVTDCNSNGTFDMCEVGAGESDCNDNWVIDSCESLTTGDYTGDSLIELSDVDGLVGCTTGPADTPSGVCAAMCLTVFDTDADNDVDLRDFANIAPLMVSP